MSNGNEVKIDPTQLASALGLPPPPPLTPDQIATGGSLMSQLLATLGLAGNAGDPQDMAEAEAGHAKRTEKTGEAMSQFPAQDQQASQQLQQLMSSATQMPQQFMQAFTGIFQSLSQGMNQAMQQGMQVGTQLASTMGKAGQGAGLGASLPADALGDALGAGGAGLGAGGGGAGLAGATAPASNLGPPPTPTAGTVPMSAQQVPVTTPPPGETPGARGQMGGGMPMMPPGAAGGAAGSGETKTDTKRVVPPAVKNGAPVQGRIATPQNAPEVVKRVAGKPIASRRILPPEIKPEENADDPDRSR